jgi:hypothetical protein
VTDLTCYVQDGENKASSRTSRSAVEEKGVLNFPGLKKKRELSERDNIFFWRSPSRLWDDVTSRSSPIQKRRGDMIDGFSLSPLLCVAMIKNCWEKNESFLYTETQQRKSKID